MAAGSRKKLEHSIGWPADHLKMGFMERFRFEDGVLHGQQVLRLLLDLEAKGYRPDVLGAHPGWGETLRLLECRWLCP
jgi:hypothetical protein